MKPLCDNEKSVGSGRFNSNSQQNQFLNSSQVRIVNFVPFSTGFILETGSNKTDPFASYVGIKLPMGVKVPHRHREHARNLESAEKIFQLILKV